ncbi:hypothetical protein MAP00_007911 [Monascus purpureus]|nr:hypothetical protein MAP00_007911 [Monascus purpureus]
MLFSLHVVIKGTSTSIEPSTHLVTEKLPLWFSLARILHTDIIQVPSSFLPPGPVAGTNRTTGDIDVVVSDLQRVADIGAAQTPPIRFGSFVYEALVGGDHVDTWEQAWEIVRKVSRSNFGICLDTFDIAARVYADPVRVDGKTPHADEDIQASIFQLHEIDMPKVFLHPGCGWGEAFQPAR